MYRDYDKDFQNKYGNSFAEIAYNYFGNLRGDTPIIDPNLPCQLNYVIHLKVVL